MNLNDKQKKKKVKKITTIHYDFVKLTGWLSAMIYLRPRVISLGKSKFAKTKGGVLITSNHVRFDDPILLLAVFWHRRLHCLATKDLFSTKLKNFFFTRMLCIKVDKDNFSMQSFREACNCLKADQAVAIFPEGEVNLSGKEMLGFKSGAVLMAHQAKKPILPMYIVKPEKWYHRRVVLLGELIDVNALCGPIPSMDALQRVTDQLQQTEFDLKQYYLDKYERKQHPHDKI